MKRLLVGRGRAYHGGFQLPSLGSRAAAPEGRQLLHAFVAHWLGRDERWGWTEARARIERIVAYLGEFYRDLDACVEWSAWQRVQRPACLAWH